MPTGATVTASRSWAKLRRSEQAFRANGSRPAGDILCGFLVERARSVARIYDFAMPLYDRCEFVHLLFADQLPIDAEFVRRETPVAAARTFARSIEPFVTKARSKGDAVTFLEVARRASANAWGQRAVATTLAFVGDLGGASRTLAPLEVSIASMDHVPRWTSDLRDLRRALGEGEAPTRALLTRWQAESRDRLGIPSRQS
jgi:hypothetical protein